jgi:2-C-methyl-D-erythritol 4-phosphate cytidylyltransferase
MDQILYWRHNKKLYVYNPKNIVLNFDHIVINKVNKINNVLYSVDHHIYFSPALLTKNNITKIIKREKRLNNTNELPSNSKYLFLTLSFQNNEVILSIPSTENIYDRWIITHKYIKNLGADKFLNIQNNKLILSERKTTWKIITHNASVLLFNKKHKLYISCDNEYNLFLTDDIECAMNIFIEDNLICHFKSALKVSIETNNMLYKNVYNPTNKNNVNVGLLLAGGNGLRFGAKKAKQLYKINNKTLLEYCIEAMSKLHFILIVTNSTCYNEIEIITKKYNNVTLLVNDINCRMESIHAGLKFLANYTINNIVIHDVARAFITATHIDELLKDSETHMMSQYYLKLVNGLHKIDKITNEIVDRDHYIELVTPQRLDFNICKFIFDTYMSSEHRVVWEFINVFDVLQIKYKLIEGTHRYLRKITYADDVKY